MQDYFEDPKNGGRLDHLLEHLEIEKPETGGVQQSMEGITFVITGSLERFENRSAAKIFIEERGGKVTGSVTSKTNYLINNDIHSNSGKNKKARELGIEILSEEEFLKRFS